MKNVIFIVLLSVSSCSDPLDKKYIQDSVMTDVWNMQLDSIDMWFLNLGTWGYMQNDKDIESATYREIYNYGKDHEIEIIQRDSASIKGEENEKRMRRVVRKEDLPQ